MTASVADYINLAVEAGVRIVSLADPYADGDLLGEQRYHDFAASYLFRLTEILRTAQAAKPVLLHICPRSFIPMLPLGYFREPGMAEAHQDYLTTGTGPPCKTALPYKAIGVSPGFQPGWEAAAGYRSFEPPVLVSPRSG